MSLLSPCKKSPKACYEYSAIFGNGEHLNLALSEFECRIISRSPLSGVHLDP